MQIGVAMAARGTRITLGINHKTGQILRFAGQTQEVVELASVYPALHLKEILSLSRKPTIKKPIGAGVLKHALGKKVGNGNLAYAN